MASRWSYTGAWAAYSDPTSCVRAPSSTEYAPPPPSQPSSNVLSIPPNATAIPEPVFSVSSIQDRATDAVPPPSSPHLAYDSSEPSDLTDMETSDEEVAAYDAVVAQKVQDETSGSSESQSECDWDDVYLKEPYSDHEDASDGDYFPDADDRDVDASPTSRAGSGVEKKDVPPRQNPPRAARRACPPEAVTVAPLRRSRRLGAASEQEGGEPSGSNDEYNDTLSSNEDYGPELKKRRIKGNGRFESGGGKGLAVQLAAATLPESTTPDRLRADVPNRT